MRVCKDHEAYFVVREAIPLCKHDVPANDCSQCSALCEHGVRYDQICEKCDE
jgi:hypothetical protein